LAYCSFIMLTFITAPLPWFNCQTIYGYLPIMPHSHLRVCWLSLFCRAPLWRCLRLGSKLVYDQQTVLTQLNDPPTTVELYLIYSFWTLAEYRLPTGRISAVEHNTNTFVNLIVFSRRIVFMWPEMCITKP